VLPSADEAVEAVGAAASNDESARGRGRGTFRRL